MTRIKQSLLLTISASVALTAIAFAQAKHMTGAAPVVSVPAADNSVWVQTVGAKTALLPKVATIGYMAPKFVLPDSSTGATTSLSRLGQGKKATVLMFISTRCPVSNAYNDRMVALSKKYGAQNVAFVGIDANTTEPSAEIAAFAKQKGFSFPVLKDAAAGVADKYNANVTPEAYVLNRVGILVYHGRIDNDMEPANVKTHELADALDATLAGKPVTKSQTKAFGCSIKRG